MTAGEAVSRKSLLAIRRGRRVARTFTFDSDILPSSPMEANANLTLTLTSDSEESGANLTSQVEWRCGHRGGGRGTLPSNV